MDDNIQRVLIHSFLEGLKRSALNVLYEMKREIKDLSARTWFVCALVYQR